MAVVNTFYQKRDEHLITYKSGQHSTQIDYLMIRRADLKSVRNCKVIPGEAVAAQHKLLYQTREETKVKNRETDQDLETERGQDHRVSGKSERKASTKNRDSARKQAFHEKCPTGSSRRDMWYHQRNTVPRKGDMVMEHRNENKIKERWREYFSNLLKVENEWDPLQDCPPVEGPLPDINEKEKVWDEKKMPAECKLGELVTIYKRKGTHWTAGTSGVSSS
ncbi:uncharacterized protein LOC125042493 [Penaeus chinensis]|uniref:uncharacterized protein LOC125042493 n=1 Tax=Penaeus chinensis TaxID=139456 RepID=UPI001FB7C4EC|nr:uncharacterized protein LOC125042493 [Penaeus chinensis]